jgi:hypothetical protein
MYICPMDYWIFTGKPDQLEFVNLLLQYVTIITYDRSL